MKNTLQNYLNHISAKLENAGIETAALDARLLLQHALKKPHEYLISYSDMPLSPSTTAHCDGFIDRRLKREPVAYITNIQDFWKDPFHVTPNVLIPRGDSETLIETCLKLLPDHAQKYRILDLGTGSGCLLLSLLREYKNAQGFGMDISEAALKIARKNAQNLALNNRASFLCANMRDEVSLQNAPDTWPDKYDIIVCNPPYISDSDMASLSDNVKNFEPHCALAGGLQGLNFYIDLFKWLPKHMHAFSVALLEVGYDQADEVKALAQQNKYGYVEKFYDLAKIARVIACAFDAPSHKISSG
jgi:release factor glutamine methyltransferase